MERKANSVVVCPQSGKNIGKPLHGIDAPNFKIDDYKCESWGKCSA